MKKHHRLQINKKSSIHMFINQPDGADYKACIIFSHGFLVPGFESNRIFVDLSNDLVRKGYKTILFDYRGSGYSDLDFSEMTLDTEMEDLASVIDYAHEIESKGKEIIVWGQSLGSGVASLVVSKSDKVDRLILWCLSAKLYDRYVVTLGEDLLKKEFKYLPSGFKVSKDFLISLKGKDVHKAIQNIPVPKLFVHGTMDEKAPYELSEIAYDISSEPKKIIKIDNGNHAFKGQPKLFQQAKLESIKWIEGM